MHRHVVFIVSLSLVALGLAAEPCAQAGDTPRFGRLNPAAPSETEQFGQLAGKWECTTASLQDDGSWRTSRAEWTWFYILDGFAVQDNYFAPKIPFMDRPLHGTNIRAFDPATKKWNVLWLQNASNTFDPPYEAVADGKNVVMTGPGRDGSGPFRVTFHNITPQSFDWRNENRQPDGTWKETFRIHAERIQ